MCPVGFWTTFLGAPSCIACPIKVFSNGTYTWYVEKSNLKTF